MSRLAVTIVVVFALALAACGGDEKPAPQAPPAAAGPAAAPAPAAPPPAGDPAELGAALAKDVLAAFDACVDDIADALKDKPAPATALPLLEAAESTYTERMDELAIRRQELPTPFGLQAFRRAISDGRPKSVARKDQLLGQYVFHYRGVVPSEEIVEMIEKRLVEVLDGVTE